MTASLFTDVDRGATVSDDAVYRYDLWRRWGTGRLLGWVMLNPSTADADTDDQTVRRCMGYARRDGYSGIVVRNLFAYRTAYPKQLAAAARAGIDVVGPENDQWLRRLALNPHNYGEIVLAWGVSCPDLRTARQRAVFRAMTGSEDRWRAVDDGRGSFAPHPARLPVDAELVVRP